MKKSLYIFFGIVVLVVGLTLKSLFNHNIEYWALIKSCSLLVFVFGLSILLFPLWEKWKYKPKKNLKQQPIKWLFYYSTSILALGVMLLLIISLENTGKHINYKIRNYYLSSDSIITDGKIIDFVRINVVKEGAEEFYLIQFKAGEEIINRGLLIDYSDWDNKNQSIDFKNSADAIVVNKIKGGKVNIQYSEKFPSFLKIIE